MGGNTGPTGPESEGGHESERKEYGRCRVGAGRLCGHWREPAPDDGGRMYGVPVPPVAAQPGGASPESPGERVRNVRPHPPDVLRPLRITETINRR